MANRIVQPLPPAEEIVQKYPITPEHHVPERRHMIEEILAGRDKRLMVIAGLCSAYPFDTVREYADRLARLQEDIEERILLVLRTYIQKPRTTVGWPGPLNQPDPLAPPDIIRGIHECRRMMCDTALKLPIADEMLFTHNGPYFDDALSYLALGARSAEDMEHRYVASGLDVPVGVKNPTSGDIEIGVNGVLAVQAPHTFALHRNQVETTGNPYAHLILRGGRDGSNYGPRSIAKADKLLKAAKVINPAIIVDASHDNSMNGEGKDPLLQEDVLIAVMHGMIREREEYNNVRGFMVESNIKAGKQPITLGMDPHVSITDACLGWEDTRRILLDAAGKL
ncbi:3-deoxy-7-phosphoheptulonate synthase [Candidatus Peribacteria bacterium RIFCSPHIGHO2_01_FULL_55_13]|nr:MAG: 3-deoxy-7-phosphoheptulonate synthase [Candidatus Peribacteria bacterium RIFCSPHIGHO2_01_FULL_55_13]